MSFEIIMHERPAAPGIATISSFRLAVLRLNFPWRARCKLYEMMIPRLRDDHGSTPDILLALYMRRLERRGILGRSTAATVAAVLSEVRDNGKTLADSLKPLIPISEFAIIDAGERGGDIALALESLITQKRRLANIYRANRRVLLTVAFFAALFLTTLYVMAVFAIPTLEPFARLMSSRRGTSEIMIVAATDWVKGSGPWWVLGILTTIIIAILFSLSRLTGRVRLILERIPPWSTYRAIEGYVWLYTYIILVRSGMSETKVLENQLLTASPYLRERLSVFQILMEQQAMLLPTALEESGFMFPSPDMIDDIGNSWGGGKDDFPRLLVSAELWANDIEREAVQRAEALRIIGFLLMWLLTGALTLATDTFIPLDRM